MQEPYVNLPEEPAKAGHTGQNRFGIVSEAQRLEKSLRARLPHIWGRHGPEGPLPRILTRALETPSDDRV